MSDPAAIERDIEADTQRAVAVARMINAGTPFDAWPAWATCALRLALAGDALGVMEQAKAVTLRRHLFRGQSFDRALAATSPDADPTIAARVGPVAERLRANLTAWVPLGAGVRLLPP